MHKQTKEGVEAEGVGGTLGLLNASYGFDGSFSIGGSIIKDEEMGLDVHVSVGVGPMNGNGVFYLRKVIKIKKLKKEEHLLVEGQLCENLYFIVSGLLKCYYILHDKKVCDWFFGEGETVVAVDSFYDQIPSEDFIQALEDCLLFYITYEELNYLYKTFVEFNVVGRVLTYKYFRIWHRQAKNIRKLTTEERYRLIMDTQPDLINRVPVQDMASYLGMSRENLSRMRGRISE